MLFPDREPASRQIETYDAWPPPPELGKKLVYMWADYYSRVAQAFETSISERCAPGFASAASDLLVKASQESTLHLLRDHMNSSEWKNTPAQASSEPDDRVTRLLTYLSSLQWEPIVLSSLTPEVGLTVEVGDPAEEAPTRPLCEMAAGAVAAMMDLLYGEGKEPEDKLFSFRAVETACRRKGSPVCRFDVERNPHIGLGECLKIDPQKH